MTINLKEKFQIHVNVDIPIVVGQDEVSGRRQLIRVISGELIGENLHGTVLPGAIDSQIIRPNGICEISARFGVLLSDNTSFYVENNGIRTAPEEYLEKIKQGFILPSELYYFCTIPTFEIYSPKLNWLILRKFICLGKKTITQVELSYYEIEM